MLEMNAVEILTECEDSSSSVIDTTLAIFHLTSDLLAGCTVIIPQTRVNETQPMFWHLYPAFPK